LETRFSQRFYSSERYNNNTMIRDKNIKKGKNKNYLTKQKNECVYKSVVLIIVTTIIISLLVTGIVVVKISQDGQLLLLFHHYSEHWSCVGYRITLSYTRT